jgi:hypothetical protein
MAKHILIAEAVIVGGIVLGILLREIPGAVREVRIWRMAGGFRAGHRYP